MMDNGLPADNVPVNQELLRFRAEVEHLRRLDPNKRATDGVTSSHGRGDRRRWQGVTNHAE